MKNSIAMRGEVTCPIALAAAALSDQWTVIVLRDIAFFNQRTFGAILENNNERIPRSTLANRLKRLCDIGLLKVRGDAKHSQRKVYSLAESALGLLPLMVEMANWSLSQDAIKAEKIDFLAELSAPKSRAMTDYMNKLRETHMAM